MNLRAPAAALLLAFVASLRADVVPAPLFQDRAVLQRDKPVPVWGRAEPGEKVSVTFAGQTVGATAGRDGRWIVYLDALAASTEPAELVIAGRNTVTVRDVVVGEVWLCAGGTGLETEVARARNAAAAAASTDFPLLRHFKIAPATAERPAETADGAWAAASPEIVGAFPAVGYFFARDLHRRLQVPVGIITVARGDSAIAAWLSPAVLAADPVLAAEPGAAGLFNGMVNPVAPYALRGVLWHQGEADVARADRYQTLFTTLITHWRAHFGQGDIPFLWAQLAGSGASDDAADRRWALLREAQDHALALPITGQAVTLDLGAPADPQEVARRLALVARAEVYGIPGDVSGPRFERADREGAVLRVRFRHADNGLIAAGKPLQAFELAGPDRVFHPAIARIERDTVVVSAAAVRNPVALRYAWRNAPEANLYNGAGLPAVPFRTDDWE